MMEEHVYAAGVRFGLGFKPGEPARVGGSPQGWLMAQIRTPQSISPGFAALPASAKIMQQLLTMRKDMKQDQDDKKNAKKELREDIRGFFLSELRAKIELASTTDTPFYERLVNFWSNHFAVSVKKVQVAGLAGAYEREAIRSHVTGRFADMLLAVARHPAMLLYLDNAQSIGPNSLAGELRGKGLNENLAREIMELHTLGVNGGYTQADVTSFAKVITGWSIAGLNDDAPGAFRFASRRHEPGTQYIMGRAYADDGEAQGVSVLRDLAAHPATARHIAAKLARHFIADDPPQGAVDMLAQVFSDTGGDLTRVYGALTGLAEAWNMRVHPKIKNSYDLLISAVRASGHGSNLDTDYCVKSLKFLGDAPFTANSPAGLPDTAQEIAGPEAMIRRVEWAQMAAVKFDPGLSPDDLAQLALGPAFSDATASAIHQAHSAREATAILFGSPEFQRR